MSDDRESAAARSAGEDFERRQAVLRRIRRLILGLDPRADLRAFLTDAARHLLEQTGASACGIATRFGETARDLYLLVPADRRPRRRVRPLGEEGRNRDLPAPADHVPRATFFYPALGELGREAGLAPGSVLSSAVYARDRVLMGLEIADPDPRMLPDAATLEALLIGTSAAFELAFLHDRVRRERLEARLLQEVGQEMGRTLDLRSLLDLIFSLLSQVVPYEAAAIYLLGEDGLEVVRHTLRGYEAEQEEMVRLKVGQGIVGWVARSGAAEIVPDVSEDDRYFNARPATRSEMVAPLKSGGRVIGVFNLESDRVNAYTAHDLQLLETFGAQAAVALERARLLEQEEGRRRLAQELRIARRIQRSFLPRLSEGRRLGGLAGRTLPSEEVSGDYYDFLERADGSLVLAVADVSGKGIPAALIMSSLRAAFRLGAVHTGDPAALCVDLNEFLKASLRESEFVTALIGTLDARRSRFTYCNAGHNPPLLLRANGALEWLETGGTILGAFAGMPYEEATVDLRKGDLLVLYTDGLTEAMDAAGEEFGTERLVSVVREHAAESPKIVTGELIQAVRRFVNGRFPDDLTVVAVRGGEDA